MERFATIAATPLRPAAPVVPSVGRDDAPAPIVALVAHASPIVVAGLVATLRGVAAFDVRIVDRARAGRDGVPHLPGRHVVFGDDRLWSGTATCGPRAGCAAWAAFVVVAPEQRRERSDVPIVDGDAWLSIDSPADRWTEIIAGLVAWGRRDPPPADRGADERPAGRGMDRAVARGGIAPKRLSDIRSYIDARLADKIGLDDLSRLAGLSACHFARAFKESTGLPPHRYLMLRRVQTAATLVKDSERPFAQISLDVGFSDQSHFTRTFARITGETPRAFRRRYR